MTFRTNKDADALSYMPGQFDQHFASKIGGIVPDWFIICGPGGGHEAESAVRTWPNVRLLGLEPSPAAFKAALARWPKSAHLLLRTAAWNVHGFAWLNFPEDVNHSTFYTNAIESELDNPMPHEIDRVNVCTTTLDRLNDEYGPFTKVALWMDIEGAERRALKGATKLFESGEVVAVNIETRPLYYDWVADFMSGYGLALTYCYFASKNRRDEVWVRP